MSELKELMRAGAGRTLAVAESLTSGRLQAQVGAISGASTFFLGGLTAYTLEQKVKLLGVDRAEAEVVNCVSARVAEQMARGACVLFGADVGVATTGYAEPAPDQGVAAPFAWWAVALRVGADYELSTGRVDGPGLGRTAMQDRVAAAAMAALIARLRAPAAPGTS